MKRKLDDIVNTAPDAYSLGPVLGFGAFGKVCVARRLADSKLFAAKCFKSNDHLKSEVRATRCLDGLELRNVVRIEGLTTINHRTFEIMELLSGGEVFRRIEKSGQFSEQAAALCLRDVACALSDLATAGIVHRDIKTENFVYQDNSNHAVVKLIDFGLAVKVPDARESRRIGSTPVGTSMYMSPETLRECWYSSKSDVWAAGVALFILLVAETPFSDVDKQLRQRQILMAHYSPLTSGLWDRISDPAKDLVRWMLQLDPANRPTPEQILLHPWIVFHAERHRVSVANVDSGEFQTTSNSSVSHFQVSIAPELNLQSDSTQSICPHPSPFATEYFSRIRRQLARERLRKALLCVRWTAGVRLAARNRRQSATPNQSIINENDLLASEPYALTIMDSECGCISPKSPITCNEEEDPMVECYDLLMPRDDSVDEVPHAGPIIENQVEDQTGVSDRLNTASDEQAITLSSSRHSVTRVYTDLEALESDADSEMSDGKINISGVPDILQDNLQVIDLPSTPSLQEVVSSEDRQLKRIRVDDEKPASPSSIPKENSFCLIL